MSEINDAQRQKLPFDKAALSPTDLN